MRSPTRIAFLAAALLAGSLGCGEGGKADPATRTVDDVFRELSTGGIPPIPSAVDGAKLGGGACKHALVGGVDTTVCGYADEGQAKAAQPAGLAAVGEATGAALAHGKLLLVVKDPDGKADPSGKAIDRITRVFLQRSPAG